MKDPIQQWLTNQLNRFRNDEIEENVYTPHIRVQSTVDEGKHLSDIERQQHVFNEIKNLVK